MHKIIELYKNGSKTKSILKELDITKEQLEKLFVEWGIPNSKGRRKWFDFNYFDKNTPEVAYHAGFGYADGSLNMDKRDGSWEYQVCIDKKDVEVLEKFCDDIGLDKKFIGTRICYPKPHKINGIMYNPKKEKEEQKRVRIITKNLDKTLRRWGIVQNKTYNFVEPQVSNELLPYFLTGFWDGDGCVYTRKRGKINYKISNVAICNYEFLEWVLEALRKVGYTGSIGLNRNKNSEGTGRLYIEGMENNFKLYDCLKIGETHYMKRKFGKIAEIRQERE